MLTCFHTDFMNEPRCGNTGEGSLQAPTTTNYDERSSTSQTDVDGLFVATDSHSHNQPNQQHKEITSFQMISSSHCLRGEAARLTASRKVWLARSPKLNKLIVNCRPCTECGRTFNRMEILAIHERAHTRNTLNKCDICGKSFLLKSALNKHYHEHRTPSGDTGRRGSHCSVFSDNKRNQCLESSTFTTKPRPWGQTGKKSYGCTLCSKMFNNSYRLRYHMRRHSSEKPYECNICKKRIKYKPNLNRHVKNHTINGAF